MEHFSIGVLAELTGMSVSTIRAWERRYGVLSPGRTAGGHRLYTPADVALLNRLAALRREGYSLRHAVQALRSGKHAPTPEPAILNEASRLGEGDLWAGCQRYVLEAVRRFSFEELDACYTTVLALYPPAVVAERLLMPVLQALGDRWDTHPGGIAEEHFFTAYVRNRLGGRFLQERRNATGPQLLLACLPGEQHELGMLHFAIALMARGFRPLYLGPHLPLAEVAALVAQSECVGVVLSGTVVVPDPDLLADLASLRTHLDSPVFIGGAVSVQHGIDLQAAGPTPVGSHYGEAIAAIERSL